MGCGTPGLSGSDCFVLPDGGLGVSFHLTTKRYSQRLGESKSDGRFGKQDFVYLPTEDVYRCPAGEKLTYRYTNEEARPY
jgi:hypothetical protein